MSRSSKGFADFFPTAPAVLQQKRSKASLDRRSHRSSTAAHSDASHGLCVPRAPSNSEPADIAVVDKSTDGELKMMHQSFSQEESDLLNGDVAHEAGSASSTSTASSIFSNVQKESNSLCHNGPHNSTNLTPLTNIDSSPRAGHLRSPKKPHHSQYKMSSDFARSPIISPLEEPSVPYDLDDGGKLSSGRRRARPGLGEEKGFKIIYDPDLDKALKALSGKEKRSRRAQYQPFGQEVRSILLV